MAPLPETNTARYVVHYSQGGKQHTQTYRMAAPPSPTVMQDFLEGLWSTMGSELLLCTIDHVDFIAAGTNIGNTVAMPAFAGQDYGTGAGSNIQSTGYYDFVARSTGGRRLRLSFYGANTTDESFRRYGTEDGGINAALAWLNSEGDFLTAIDGLSVVWKPYANFAYNAYWQRHSRS